MPGYAGAGQAQIIRQGINVKWFSVQQDRRARIKMMKKISILAVLIFSSLCAHAQTGVLPGYCVQGATQAKTSGSPSSNYLQGIIPYCTVSVYLTGTTTLATIYADGSNTPLTNPFQADASGSWLFWAALNQAYDITLSGGIYPNTYSVPITETGVSPNVAGGGYFPCSPAVSGNITCTGTVAAGAIVGAIYSNMPHWHAKLATLMDGGGGFPRFGWEGDSTIWGSTATVATSPGVDFCNDITAYDGYPCAWGSWFGGGTGSGSSFWQNDPRIISTGWAIDSGASTIGVHPLAQSTAAGQLCFTPVQAVNTFEIYWLEGPAAGVLNYTIDGGSAVSITTTGSTVSMQRTSISAGSPGSHTLCHEWASGGQVDLVGDISYNSTVPSVIAVLMGAPGAASAALSATAQAYAPGNSQPYAAIGLDAAVVEIGAINDWIQGVPAATTGVNLQTVVTALETAGADVDIYTPVPSNPTTTTIPQATQALTVAAMKAVATANKNANTVDTLPITDNFSAWVSEAASANRYGDGSVHPSAIGYAINAQAVETTTVVEPGIMSGFNPSPWAATSPFYLPSVISPASNYTLLCTEGTLFASAGYTVTLPSTCPNNYQVQIDAFQGPITLSGSLGIGMPSSVPARGTITTQFVGGSWWATATSYGLGAQALDLSCVQITSTYTVTGNEGCLLTAGATVTLPDLNASYVGANFNGFTLSIKEYGLASTLTVGGLNVDVPTSLPPLSSLIVTYYNGDWFDITGNRQPTYNSCLLTAGNYSLTGRESCILVSTGTTTLPNLGAAFNGFTLPIIDYSGSVTISVGGSNVNVPTTLPGKASIYVTYYAGAWYLVSGQGLPITGLPVSASGTYTTATSDAFTVTGATASSHCTFSATNALAAAATVAPYISALGTNTITITHVATTASGGTIDILCTSN